MDQLRLKNFRCFQDPGYAPLAPLTVLVGENSTGKSAFLAALRLAWDVAYGIRQIRFNEEPFLLGAFDQIAHFRGGKAGRAKKFELAFQGRARRRRRRSKRLPATLNLTHGAEFRRAGSHPEIERQFLQCQEYFFDAYLPKDKSPRLEIHVGDKRLSQTVDEDRLRLRFEPGAPVDWMYLLFSLPEFRIGRGRKIEQTTKITRQELDDIEDIVMNAKFGTSPRPVAVAPVRSRPERTYNPVSDLPLPEGQHIPMVLAKTYFEDEKSWDRLERVLEQFGSASGLFRNLTIKPLGQHESDPFQIRVKVEGPASNLVDVGYGVSQVLPILVDAILSERGSLYLLQQPEVHLHPRAQAELGSFLAEFAAKQAKRFVVETHSDYILDRIRMDVRDNSGIKPEHVSILFFERTGLEVAIHSMRLDTEGNLINVPEGYRSFFLEEERRLLSG